MTDLPSEDARLRLAYDEGFRALDIQRDDHERLRSRVVTLVSVASIAAGLLGGFSATKSHQSHVWLLYLGVAAFVALVGCVCVILSPRKWWFETDPRRLLTDYVDAGRDLNYTLRWAAHYAGENAEKNRRKLDRLSWVYLAAIAALGLLVASFAVSLATRS